MGRLVRGFRWYLMSACAAGVFVAAASEGRSDMGAGALDLKTAISRVVKENLRAVVHIEAVREERVVFPSAPFEQEPLLQYAYLLAERVLGEVNPRGTGMIIDREGHVLTSHHVVAGAQEIRVVMDSGKQYPATLVGSDPKTNLAVVRVVTQDFLPHVVFGDSDKLDLGEWVVAIGHPRDREPIVSQGIVRARHRKGVTDPATFRDLLQTDAAANRASCGGPLLNLRGEVIGINSALLADGPDFHGIGFAIPGNAALSVAGKLMAHGEVKRGWLGIRVQPVAPERDRRRGAAEGALVYDVLQGGPGDRAGLQKGDIVIAFQGRPVEDVASLRDAVAHAAVGEEVQITILRQEGEELVTVRIGSVEEWGRTPATPLKAHLGADMRPVTQEEARKFNIKPHQGVMITWVDPQGPFGRVGFEAGDIILEVNGRAFKNPEGFLPFLDSPDPGRRITIFALDHRSGHRGYVQIKMK